MEFVICYQANPELSSSLLYPVGIPDLTLTSMPTCGSTCGLDLAFETPGFLKPMNVCVCSGSQLAVPLLHSWALRPKQATSSLCICQILHLVMGTKWIIHRACLPQWLTKNKCSPNMNFCHDCLDYKNNLLTGLGACNLAPFQYILASEVEGLPLSLSHQAAKSNTVDLGSTLSKMFDISLC